MNVRKRLKQLFPGVQTCGTKAHIYKRLQEAERSSLEMRELQIEHDDVAPRKCAWCGAALDDAVHASPGCCELYYRPVCSRACLLDHEDLCGQAPDEVGHQCPEDDPHLYNKVRRREGGATLIQEDDKSDDAVSEPSSCPRALYGSKTDVNFATQGGLNVVPQIGRVLAARIVESAPYATWDEVQALKHSVV